MRNTEEDGDKEDTEVAGYQSNSIYKVCRYSGYFVCVPNREDVQMNFELFFSRIQKKAAS